MLYDKICDITTFSNDKHFQEIKKNDHKMRRLCEKVLVEQEIISGHRTFAVRWFCAFQNEFIVYKNHTIKI